MSRPNTIWTYDISDRTVVAWRSDAANPEATEVTFTEDDLDDMAKVLARTHPPEREHDDRPRLSRPDRH